MDKDWKPKVTDIDNSEVTYDKKKLHRMLEAFNSIFELQVGSLDFDYLDEYLNMTVVMETFHLNFFKHLLKNDKTVLPYVVLVEILDRLNEVNINFEDPHDDFLGPTDLLNLPLDLIAPFPHYYRTSPPETKIDILKYFLNDLDLEKYNVDILYLMTIIISGVLLDNVDTDYFIPAIDKLFKSISKFSSEELSESFHEVFSKLIASYIKNFVLLDYPLEEVLKKVDGVKHLYGAYGPIISFLTVNDEIDIAYEYIINIIDEGLENFEVDNHYEDGLSIGLQTFLYISLCLDKLDYFKEIFPAYLNMPHDRLEVDILLLLFKKVAHLDDYEDYIKQLKDNEEIYEPSKREVKKFYLRNKTSSH